MSSSSQPEGGSNDPIVINPIGADETPYEIESLCMNCRENGLTKLLLTKIPHFREVAIMAFECEACGFKNSEVQDAGTVHEKGVKYELRVEDERDLNRQVVKGNECTIRIAELDLEIPKVTQRGSLSTVEGILMGVADGLEQDQEARHRVDPETAKQLDIFIGSVKEYAAGSHRFNMIIDDPLGGSFVENPWAPGDDPRMTTVHYERSRKLNVKLGLLPPNEDDLAAQAQESDGSGSGAGAGAGAEAQGRDFGVARLEGSLESTMAKLFKAAGNSDYTAPEEVMVLPGTCWLCNTIGENRMYITTVPHFKEIVLMAFTCDTCGYRSVEVKPGGGVEPKGKRITLHVKNPRDMSRDLLKSETAGIEIPEMMLELVPGTLGGRFTTIEGIVQKIHENLKDANMFQFGDSADPMKKQGFDTWLESLEELQSGLKPFTIIVDDPMGNSFVEKLGTGKERDGEIIDPQVEVEEYERTPEQNDEWGISDMKV